MPQELNILAAFLMSPSSGPAPLLVRFTNQSTRFATCVWNFGDGKTSTLVSPVHTYEVEGTYIVTLTITDDLGQSDSTEQMLVITPDVEEEETSQHGLFTYKRFSPGQVSVSSRKISGSIFSSEYPFSGVGITSLNPITGVGIFELQGSATTSTGPNIIEYHDTELDGVEFDAYCTSHASDGVEGFLFAARPSGTSAIQDWNTAFGDVSPRPIQMFKITGVSHNDIHLDRVPIFYAPTDVNSQINLVAIIRPKTGGTVEYDSHNSKFLHTNFALDSYQNLHTTGITNIDNSYIGTISYFGMDEGDGQTLTISSIPFSGYEAGDKLTPGTFLYNIPWIMWHKQTTEGITLYDVYGSVELDEVTGLRFKYLRDGITEDDNIVGKVFYDKKVITITDKELNAALMFQSNRNWTLPEPRILDGGTGGDSSEDLKYYISYTVRDVEDINFTAATAHGYNNSYHPVNPMHCAYVKSIVPSEDGRRFRIEAQDSPWVAQDVSVGSGFSQDHIAIIIGTGTTGSTYAEDDSWKVSACTATSSLANGFVIPDYSAFTDDYKWGCEYTFDREEFPIGNQTVGFGYMSGHFESIIYKMSASCVARNGEFNETQNETFDGNVNSDIFITEVALYNEQNEMLMIGKLNNPIIKNNEKYVTIRVELDL